MKTFDCDACGNLVFFENTSCLKCGHALGFLPDVLELSAMEKEGESIERSLSARGQGRRYRRCANDRLHDVCNWRIPETEPDEFCSACRLNEIIPNLSVLGNRERWHRLELAKRRLVFTLLTLHLPLAGEANAPPLRFRFLDDVDGNMPVTGHAHGVITLYLAEANDDVREKHRVSLREPLRTLVGHFRHEAAHYYWERLIEGSPRIESFRALFGDERADYTAALQRHYQSGPPEDWPARFVSAYASAHPWEDWAETTAHLFQILDVTETAASFGMSLHPSQHPAAATMTTEARHALQPQAGFEPLMAAWFPLTYALNALNRSAGLPDLYPFVLGGDAIRKLRFVHEVMLSGSR